MKHQVSIQLLLMSMLFVLFLPYNIVGFILRNPLNKDVHYRAKYQGKHQGVLDQYYTIKAGEQKEVAATFTPLEHADAGRDLKIITL